MKNTTKQNRAKRLVEALDRRAPSLDGAPTIPQAATLIRRQDEVLGQALVCLEELVPDPQCDFGPAYEMMAARQRAAVAAIQALLEEK